MGRLVVDDWGYNESYGGRCRRPTTFGWYCRRGDHANNPNAPCALVPHWWYRLMHTVLVTGALPPADRRDRLGALLSLVALVVVVAVVLVIAGIYGIR